MSPIASPLLLVLALLAPPQASPAQAELVQGQQLFAAARYEEAELAFGTATRKEPQNAAAWNLLGLAHHAQKEWGSAATAFERALAIAPQERLLHQNLGVARFELHELDKARVCFEKAIALDAQDSRSHLFLARIALARGETEAAERELALAVAAKEPDPLAFFHQGVFLFQARRLDEARKALERAVELDPGLPGAHLNLGLVLRRSGDEAGAERHLARFRELSEVLVGEERKRQRVTAHLKAANADIEAGNAAAALQSALAAREEMPELPLVHRFLARIYALQGRPEDAARANARADQLERGGGR